LARQLAQRNLQARISGSIELSEQNSLFLE
jgi:hypothetical protein